MAFVTCHFINHSFGIRSIAAMSAASHFFIAPWQTRPGLMLLYGAFVGHAFLGFVALHRRRHFKLPASEIWQLALGFTIPLLLLDHAGSIRLGTSYYGMDFGYERVLYHLWVISPDNALLRQLLLLLVVWSHACLGLRAYLATKTWYADLAGVLGTLAVLVPAMALFGVVSAGLDIRDAAQTNPGFASAIAEALAKQSAQTGRLHRAVNTLTILYLSLVLGTLALRVWRDWYTANYGPNHITYPGSRVVMARPGSTLLEISRWAGIPHASVCGGRGRCSTCRVRVVAGTPTPAGPVELQTLRRINAPPNVRLACQLRPTTDLSIQPIVPIAMAAGSIAARFTAAVEGGRELPIAAMFVDMRGSTRLAAGLLPYDALYLFDLYIQVVTGAIRQHGGNVTSIAGDGVMAVFGIKGTADIAARGALLAALDVWSGLERLNTDLASELPAPMRIGIGIHVGVSIIGLIAADNGQALQFLGDCGNIAAKLEAKTKDYNCTLIASCAALDVGVPQAAPAEIAAIAFDGRSEPVRSAIFREKDELQRILAFPIGV